jgi:hypothetical protein
VGGERLATRQPLKQFSAPLHHVQTMLDIALPESAISSSR